MPAYIATVGALVIISWAYTLIVDTMANLLDMCPDLKLKDALQAVIEKDGSKVTDLHVWRLGVGFLGAVISVCPSSPSVTLGDFHRRIRGFKALSHVTIEVIPADRSKKRI